MLAYELWIVVPYVPCNDPQSVYAQHILKNQHECGPITDTMTLLKSEHKTSMLILYEQLYIQTYHHNGHLIPEQSTGDTNLLIQLIIDTLPTTEIATEPNSAQYLLTYSMEQSPSWEANWFCC